MQRAKLKALVRASLTQQQTISTEGFLGDLASKISSIFSMRKKVLTEKESEKLLEDHKAVINRLNETVLNPKWMDKAELKTAVISADWAIPGLDYEIALNSEVVVPHLEKCISKFLSDFTAFRVIQKKYSDDINALFADFLDDIADSAKAGKDVSEVIAKYEKKSKSITDPIKLLDSKPISVFGNQKIQYDKKHKMAINGNMGPSKVKSIKPLTKDEIYTVASMIVKLIESPLSNDDDLIWSIDYADVKNRLKKEGIDPAAIETIAEEVNDSVVMERFYHQNAWDYSGTYDCIWEHNTLIKRLFRLIDASIK